MMAWLIALFLGCWLIPTAWADTGWGLKRGSNIPVVWNGTDTCEDPDWLFIVNQSLGEVNHCDWDVPKGAAALNDDEYFNEPDVRISSFKSFVNTDPGPGTCLFQGYEIEREDTGKKWSCPFEGANTNAVEEAATADGFSALTLDGILYIPDGPTQITHRSALRTHATDCTTITDGLSGQACYEQDSDRIFVCEPTAGGCDTAAEWRPAGGGERTHRYPFGCTDDWVGSEKRYLYGEASSGTTCGTQPELTSGGTLAIVGRAGTLKNLRCRTSSSGPGTGNSLVFVVRYAAADTALGCTITHPATSCSDTANTQAVVAGERLGMSYDPSADVTMGVLCSVEVAYE